VLELEVGGGSKGGGVQDQGLGLVADFSHPKSVRIARRAQVCSIMYLRQGGFLTDKVNKIGIESFKLKGSFEISISSGVLPCINIEPILS